nr:hypothetical protein [Pleomorphovibrio marinus]
MKAASGRWVNSGARFRYALFTLDDLKAGGHMYMYKSQSAWK